MNLTAPSPQVDVEQPITRGSVWEQKIIGPAGTIQIRRIEIIAPPTLSSPVGYKILQNDAHPHRKGKTASIRVADLRRKFEWVSA